MHQSNKNTHAVVMGGSMAGLFTARVLSDHFDQVTIIERDPVHDQPESRKGQPQTRHLHGVLRPAQDFLEKYLDGTVEKLLDGGAIIGDWGSNIRWWQFGGYRVNAEIDMHGISLSRPFMEYHVRKAVLAIKNISLCDNTSADALVMDESNSRVVGLKISHRSQHGEEEILPTDLVIDACGRGTPLPKWLNQLGYDKPEKEEVKIRVKYTTRVYHRVGEHIDNPKLYMIATSPPHDYIGTFMFPVEDNRWIVTAGGWHGHHAPTDEAEFMDFLQTLPTPDIYDILSESEPISDIMTHNYPASRRFNYNKLNRFPDGLLVIGDSAASFNPIYGQGMSSAALQAEALNEVLSAGSTGSLWREFFAKQAKIIDLPWTLTVGEDFRYPETEGKKPFAIDLVNKYVEAVHRATHKDKVVYEQFLQVMNLLEPPTTLMRPSIVWRVLRAQ
ncbi:MAG: FAD-binding monooxygenase [Chloroflexota bacterium]